MRYIGIFMLAMALTGCSATPKEQMFSVLKEASLQNVPLFGHQDDLMYGHTWNVTKEEDHSMTRSDVLSTGGAYPYILGLDLGGLETDSRYNLDGNDFELMREAAVKHYERGGIVTLSWHLRNPLTGGDAWDVSSDKVVESILPGGEKHDYFVGWLDRIASYIASLKDAQGRQIPVIFRPWHEHTGGWFWWGTGLCTAEQYNELWKMTYDYIVKEKGIKDLVWAISPGASDNDFEAWESRYPGDAYVDIVGLDGYCATYMPQPEALESFVTKIRSCLGSLQKFAEEHGKILALTETGYEGLTYEKWWTEALQPAIEGIPIAYLLVWRNTDEMPRGMVHFYAPWPGGPSEADFREFVENGKIRLLPSGRQSSGTTPALKVEGVHLYQEGCAEPVAWRGLSFGWHNLWPRFYNKEAVNTLSKEWGCPVFRAAIGADDLAEKSPLGGYISDPENALKCLYAVVDGAIENNAYVIVDWHSHILHQAEAEEFFRTVATKYAGCTNVIYELFNEPVSQEFEDSFDYAEPSQESLDAYWARLKGYAQTLIPIIEECSGCHPLILMGCPRWDQALDCAIRNPIEGYDNLMYTTHFYAATHGQWLRDRSDAAMAAGLPVFISECAACEASGDGHMDLKEWEKWNEWAAQRQISMLTWSISDKNETCSMFIPEATSEGLWEDSVIKEWGLVSREWLKK